MNNIINIILYILLIIYLAYDKNCNNIDTPYRLTLLVLVVILLILEIKVKNKESFIGYGQCDSTIGNDLMPVNNWDRDIDLNSVYKFYRDVDYYPYYPNQKSGYGLRNFQDDLYVNGPPQTNFYQH